MTRFLNLIRSVSEHILAKKLFKPNQFLLVTISGGQDSVCLFLILLHLKNQWKWKMQIIYCNHLWQMDSFFIIKQLVKFIKLFSISFSIITTTTTIFSEKEARTWRYFVFYRLAIFFQPSFLENLNLLRFQKLKKKIYLPTYSKEPTAKQPAENQPVVTSPQGERPVAPLPFGESPGVPGRNAAGPKLLWPPAALWPVAALPFAERPATLCYMYLEQKKRHLPDQTAANQKHPGIIRFLGLVGTEFQLILKSRSFLGCRETTNLKGPATPWSDRPSCYKQQVLQLLPHDFVGPLGLVPTNGTLRGCNNRLLCFPSYYRRRRKNTLQLSNQAPKNDQSSATANPKKPSSKGYPPGFFSASRNPFDLRRCDYRQETFSKQQDSCLNKSYSLTNGRNLYKLILVFTLSQTLKVCKITTTTPSALKGPSAPLGWLSDDNPGRRSQVSNNKTTILRVLGKGFFIYSTKKLRSFLYRSKILTINKIFQYPVFSLFWFSTNKFQFIILLEGHTPKTLKSRSFPTRECNNRLFPLRGGNSRVRTQQGRRSSGPRVRTPRLFHCRLLRPPLGKDRLLRLPKGKGRLLAQECAIMLHMHRNDISIHINMLRSPPGEDRLRRGLLSRDSNNYSLKPRKEKLILKNIQRKNDNNLTGRPPAYNQTSSTLYPIDRGGDAVIGQVCYVGSTQRYNGSGAPTRASLGKRRKKPLISPLYNRKTSFVIGHSANDKVETLLFNLIRGSGLNGLFSLRWKRYLQNTKFKKMVLKETSLFQFHSGFFIMNNQLHNFYI